MTDGRTNLGLPPPPPVRPTAAQLQAARDSVIADLVAPDLRVLFVGINPGLYSGATGWHFARPGNRFWPVLFGSGFTERLLEPREQHELLRCRLGITNLVPRTTARADELATGELRAGAERLAALVRAIRPAWVAVLGVSAWRLAFDAPGAEVGRQDSRLVGARTWILPNPSGLNAHYTLPRLVAAFTALREAAAGDLA